jgi:hypothetical protein
MAKRKNAAALFEVIHADKRFAQPRRPVWNMPSPLSWLRRRGNGDGHVAVDVAPAVMEPGGQAAPAAPREPSKFWSLIPPMPRVLLDPDRHVMDLKVSYTTAIVSAFAIFAVVALAFVIGRRMSHPTLPALAEQTTEELRAGPPQPDVLDVGPETAPMAMATQQRPAAPRTTTPPLATKAADPTSQAAAPQPNAPEMNGKRTVNVHYVIVQSYPEQERQMAQEACDLLNKHGILCTVVTGLHYAPNWHVVVGVTGFDRVRNSPEYDRYVARIQQIGQEFGGSSKFKKFEPRAFKWQEPKPAAAR